MKNDIKTCSINFNEHIKEEEFRVHMSNLNTEQQSEIYKLINSYKSIFAKDKYDIGTVKEYEARIDLLVDKYCCKRPYRCTIEDKKEIEEQIAKLLDRNLIEESYSPFAAPVTLAFKKEENKKSRLCIDFRDLNKIVVPQAQPFPLIDELVVKTRNSKYFTTLDINSAFWSIPLRIEDRNKTAFVTQEGHYQWTCLPFGLKTSPAIFQRILSNILRKYKLTEFAVNYIDDILVYSKTFTEHIDHLTQLLEAIKKEGFRLKFTKCTFASNSVKYLGHIIQNNTVRPVTNNLVAIQDFPTPKNQKNVRQFLGKVNFYREYIPNSAIILEPLHNLLRKNQKFTWSADCQKSFEYIKKILCSQPILEIFDQNLPIIIHTDASLEGIGAVLKQTQPNGKNKPVAYFSKKLNQVQKKKKAIYLECLAIKEAIKYWQYWLIGKSFIVYSDHKPLENLNIKSRTDEELGDLTYYLSQFDFKIVYTPGKENTEADCLSRNPVLDENDDSDDRLKLVNMITLNEIVTDQENNLNIQNNKSNLILKDRVYYKKIRNREKIILSENFSKILIKDVHENMCHIGEKQMQSKISTIYTAKNLIKNIKSHCKNCAICIKNKTRGQVKYGLMSHLGPATKPFEIVSIDTIGGFGGSRSTKRYLHLLVDHFTRYAYIVTSKTQSAHDFIKLINKVTDSNTIRLLLTDQYPGINSKEFKTFLKEKSISIIFTAVNSPFSNGLNERLNQTLVNKIRCKINENNIRKAWTTIAHDCIDKYNNTEHTVTGFAPKYLLYGTDVSFLPTELKKNKSELEWQQDRDIAFKNSVKSHKYNKQIFDKNRAQFNFNVGDLVYVENGNRLNRNKLDEIKIGPFKIIEKVSNSIYRISTNHKKSESNLFHITKLIPTPETVLIK
ncbi:Retrotransposable element Tf2 155 kDa protein type 1 [Papilio machaon]|uniref:RNA-directed DNA polymerase n=1 Tax=Papilio machaon TaxID=76193 RepID=A0A0N0PCL2_PAPMA|nr:Retrotransposable element Tf2 155 kDa protein type 1 [Papilio machaon]